MSERERQTYVYRLVVQYPPGSLEWDWEPEGWDPEWHGDPTADLSFRWPAVRKVLTKGTAERRAALLRKYGAKVTIERSDAVTWSDNGEGP